MHDTFLLKNANKPTVSITKICLDSQDPLHDRQNSLNKVEFNVEKLVNPFEKMQAERGHPRWSDKLQDQILEKDIPCKKRSMEGNSFPPNSFSVLDSWK
jgi:hypothetical protein